MVLEKIQKSVEHKLSLNAAMIDENVEISDINLNGYDGLKIQCGERKIIVIHEDCEEEISLSLYNSDDDSILEDDELADNYYIDGCCCHEKSIEYIVNVIIGFLEDDYKEFEINED